MAARPPGVGRALGNGHCVAENVARTGRLKIAHRRAVPDLESLSWHGAVSIIF